MAKRKKKLFLLALLFAFAALVVETLYVSSIYGGLHMSGFSVKSFLKSYSNLNASSKIFLAVQWGLILIILAGIMITRHKKEIKPHEKVHATEKLKGSATSLDAFYEIIKEKRELSIKSASDIFNVSPDLAMEWAKILEAGDLITIEYTAFGGPIAVLKEEESENAKDNAKEKNKPKKEEMGEKKETQSKREKRFEKKIKKIKKKKEKIVKKRLKK